MKHWTLTLVFGLAASAVLTAPILAQRSGDRPSRSCVQEIRKLCSSAGRDRSKIRACLQEKGEQLSSSCQAELRDRMQQRGQQGRAGGEQAFRASAKVDQTIFYGADQRQQIDIYKPKDAVDDLPLILHIHGGGWRMGNHKLVQSKPQHFTKNGYIFASAGYRLLPDAPVEDQAKDIGLAIQALVGQANDIGFAPGSIILMGHSAGAHLAALVSTDPQYAADAFNAIKGVVLLDGAAYDIPATIKTASSRSLSTYQNAFGDDPERQKALSPITFAGGQTAPNWLALYVDSRVRAKSQAVSLTNALASAGANVTATAISNTDHGRLNRDIGTPAGAQQTQAIDAFLAGLTAT